MSNQKGLLKFGAVNDIFVYLDDNGLTDVLRSEIGNDAYCEMIGNPSGTSLERIFEVLEILGLSASIVVHKFPESEISSSKVVLGQIFHRCWEECGKPTTMMDFDEYGDN
jgi:hypothetical protein